MARVLAGALIGVICTVIFYFIPVVNAIAPLLGGLLAGYYADGGFGVGLKTGVLMTIFMVIPGILLQYFTNWIEKSFSNKEIIISRIFVTDYL